VVEIGMTADGYVEVTPRSPASLVAVDGGVVGVGAQRTAEDSHADSKMGRVNGDEAAGARWKVCLAPPRDRPVFSR
jgi:hypothetical protein